MSFDPDPRLLEAKAIPMRDLVLRLGIANLRNTSGELIGPCPLCGGTDRFGINLRSGAYNCRRCGICGGDQVALTRDVLNLGFKDALTWLCGDAPAVVDPEEMKRRQARAEAARKQQDSYAAAARRKAKRDARVIWKQAQNGLTSPELRAYLEGRGLGALFLRSFPSALSTFPAALRFLPDHPCVKKVDGALRTLHRGPAMIAVIQDAAGNGTAVHQTWIDPDRPGKKASICFGDTPQASKMVRGSKKGGAIRLITPEGADTLVMGEGIETTLSAYCADAVPGAAYWAGVDLGNMAGKMQRIAGVKWSGKPDLSDTEAFVPPAWCRRLYLILDGDSHPTATRAKLESGLLRAMHARPGLTGLVVTVGDGIDLNDLLTQEREGADDGQQ